MLSSCKAPCYSWYSNAGCSFFRRDCLRCTALPAISVLVQCSTPAPSVSVAQYMISLALSYSSNNVQTWLFPWTLNHRTLTCLLLQPGSTGLFVPACMCVFDPLSWSCGRKKLKFVGCEDRPALIWWRECGKSAV